MDFVIDGYNLLHAIGAMKSRKGPSGLEQARERLLGILKGSFADDAAAVTVVFDAAQAPADVPQQTSHRGIHIRFARGQEADDVIETLIEQHSSPKKLTVVSDDHRLRRAARRRRAECMSCSEFMSHLGERRRKLRTQQPEKIENLSAADTQQLLDEFGYLDEELRRVFGVIDFD